MLILPGSESRTPWLLNAHVCVEPAAARAAPSASPAPLEGIALGFLLASDPVVPSRSRFCI